MEERNPALHRVSMTGRRAAILTGVEDVLSFDEHEILLQTTEGVLTIKGEDLHVNRLSVEKVKLTWKAELQACLIPIKTVSGKTESPYSVDYFGRG